MVAHKSHDFSICYAESDEFHDLLAAGPFSHCGANMLLCVFSTYTPRVFIFLFHERRENGFETNVSCNGASDGSIDLTVSGGAPPYSFEWTNSDGLVISNDEDLIDLPTGTYFVSVTDDNSVIERVKKRLNVEFRLFNLYC